MRGFQPFPRSFTNYKGQKLTVWKANEIEDLEAESQSGEIIEARGDQLYVGCGENTALRVEELQIQGKTTNDD